MGWTVSLAALAARIALGLFFVSYRFRWLIDPSPPDGVHWCSPYRHMTLRRKMLACGFGDVPRLASFVAVVELLAGLGVLFGLLTWLSALGLLVILLVATRCTAREKTLKQAPVDRIDVVSCYLWNPEPPYIVLALIVLCLGGSAWSLDALILAVLS